MRSSKAQRRRVRPRVTSATGIACPAGVQRGCLTSSDRSEVLGGVAPKSLRRCELVRDRHVLCCEQHGIETWDRIDRKASERYGNWMFKKYAYRTCYAELTQIKAACNWLIQEELLSINGLFVGQSGTSVDQPQYGHCIRSAATSRGTFTSQLQCGHHPRMVFASDWRTYPLDDR